MILMMMIVIFPIFLGWRISDRSIRAGLECTYLPGRSQFLTYKEAEALGLPGATILLDGGLILVCVLQYY